MLKLRKAWLRLIYILRDLFFFTLNSRHELFCCCLMIFLNPEWMFRSQQSEYVHQIISPMTQICNQDENSHLLYEQSWWYDCSGMKNLIKKYNCMGEYHLLSTILAYTLATLVLWTIHPVCLFVHNQERSWPISC